MSKALHQGSLSANYITNHVMSRKKHCAPEQLHHRFEVDGYIQRCREQRQLLRSLPPPKDKIPNIQANTAPPLWQTHSQGRIQLL